MTISATVRNTPGGHQVSVNTNGTVKSVEIPGKDSGRGSSVNGGELLFLALATCFCNDIFREASRRAMQIDAVHVEVSGEFGAEGEPGKNIRYAVIITAPGSSAVEINRLITDVDRIAEIHNTLRKGVSVELTLR